MVSGLKNIKWKWLAQKINYFQWCPYDHDDHYELKYNLALQRWFLKTLADIYFYHRQVI